ncbi:uncharacterized protein LOC126833709 [Adelges cooleyi]|uniref:uncharacterized protein LOC126833709 n=1 Tax=Adelges cooleyi TaxID=133065 RepID=UPI00217F899D|nr:uncharacterized protein LOC126833709 [Adelges cooleyi]
MHVKSAVILCAFYFLTSAWSIGLNSSQLKQIINLYESHKMPASRITSQNITKLLKESFGIQKPEELFDCDSNLKELLLTLAYEDKKKHDSFETQMLTPFEVEFFLSVFVEHVNITDQDGCLGPEQLPGVLKDLKLENTEIENIVEKLKDKKETVQFVINEADFLLTMLKIKPVGYGLNVQQIEKFIDLFNNCPKTVSGGVDPLEIQKIFIEFGMADPKHDSKMLFKSNRSAAKEIMELMLVTAERSRAEPVDAQGFMDTYEVQFVLDEFVSYDKDSDGFLTHEELSTWLELARRDMYAEPKSGHPQHNDGSETNFAKLLKMMIPYYVHNHDESFFY